MSQRSTQERLASLESQLAVLRDEVRSVASTQPKNWRRAIEKYAGDEDLLKIFSDAMRLREADRRRNKRRPQRRKSR